VTFSEFANVLWKTDSLEIGGGRVEAERVVGELAHPEASGLGPADHHRDVGLSFGQRKAARHGDELKDQIRMPLSEPTQPGRQKGDPRSPTR
jgi:hypothetical protein